MRNEPVLISQAITKAIYAVLSCLVLLNVVSLSDQQLAGIIVAVEAVLGVPLAFWARSRVTPITRS